MAEFVNAPGKKTSEFYVTMITLLISVLGMFGIVKPAMQAELTNNLIVVVTAVVTMIGGVGTAISYIVGRSWLKAKTAKELKNGSSQ